MIRSTTDQGSQVHPRCAARLAKRRRGGGRACIRPGASTQRSSPAGRLPVSTRWPGNLFREGRTETAKVDTLDEEAVENYARAVAGPVLHPPGGVPGAHGSDGAQA